MTLNVEMEVHPKRKKADFFGIQEGGGIFRGSVSRSKRFI